MRNSIWIFTIALLAALVFIFWVASPVWVQTGSEINTGDTVSMISVVLAQESPAPDNTAAGETPEPTRMSRPTPTPIPTPPPTNPGTIQMMVIFGILVVVVVIFGLWLNRNRVF